MQTRLVAYDALGAWRGVLPNPLEVSITTGHNELGVVAIHYDRNSPKYELLEDQPEIALERFDGTQWVEIRNTRAKCLTVDFDHLEEVPTRRYDFIGVGEGLKGVLVYASYGMTLNDEGKVQFAESNPGRIIKTVWDNAVTRGWNGFFYSFSATHDSAGQPWAKTFSISYSFDANLLAILAQLVAQGTCDYEWDGRTLNLYNPETYLARDISEGPDPVRFFGTGNLNGVDSAPEKQDVGQLATHVVVLGEGGLRWEFETGTIVPEGRREIILQYSGVDDIGTAQILAAPTILKSQNHLKNTTRQFHLTEETKHLPYVHYRPGDWAYIQRGTEFEKMRIFSMNLQINQNGTQGYVTLGDKIDSLLEVLYARIQGMTGGIANETANQPPRVGDRKPSPPYGVVVTTGAFISATGQTQGIVGLNWSHNGKDIYGEAIGIKNFSVYYRKLGDSNWIPLLDTPDNTQHAEYSPLQVYDEDRNRITYEFMVRARSNYEYVMSDPSAIVQIQMVDDVTAPPRPTPPDVTTWLRTVTVKWDGMGLSPSNVLVDLPADYNKTFVWQATSPDMAGKTLVGTFTDDVPLWQSDTMPADVTVWYALSNVDWSGNESALSDSVSVTPRANVDVGEITDVIDGALLGENSVDYIALLASEQMWVRVLGAHKIKAGEIDVNSLTADTAWIGSLRTGILVANAVDATIIKADAITSKHTLTGPVYQTHAEINTGIKIDPSNGFRAYDAGGNQRVIINNSGATFTGTVKSGFGTNWAAIMDNAGRGRPGLQLGSNTTDFWQPQVLGTAGLDGYSSGALMAVSGRADGGSYYSQLVLQKGGDWRVGDYNGSQSATAIYSMAPNIVKIQGGAATIQAGGTVAYMQAGNGTVQVDNGGTTVWGAFAVTGSKNFIMDHPTKVGWDLRHGSTESPVSGVEYWKCGVLGDDGTALVQLPDYFEALIKPGSACIGVWANGSIVSWTDITDNQFTVSGEPGAQFTWLVKAERTGGDFEVESVKPVHSEPIGPQPEEQSR